MIDTDKYEGHIAGPWKLKGKITIDKEYIATGHLVLGGKAKGSMLHTIDTQPSKCGCTDVNAQLIADAPLLLEEVNRHRPPRVDGKYMAWSDRHPKYDRSTWIEQVMEGITDVGYWTWVNWQLQYGDEEE